MAIKLHLIVRIQSWSLGMLSNPSTPLFLGSLLPRVVVPVRVLSLGQIELFNHLLRIIIIGYLKLCSCMQIVHIR